MTMKQRADGVLLMLVILFASSLLVMRVVGEPIWLLAMQAILEGALVGSVADWFAVKALFDAPLGIRLHTRLIPRNREKLLYAIADGVQKQVLSGRVIRSRVSETMITERLVSAVGSYGIERILEAVWIRCAKDENLARFAVRFIRDKGKDCVIADAVTDEMLCIISGKLLKMGSRIAESESFFLQVKSYLDAMMEKKADGMLAKLFVFFGAVSGAVDTSDAARAFSQRLGTRLTQASEREDDMLRVWLMREMRALLMRLDEDQTILCILEHSRVSDLISELAESVASAVQANGKDVFVAEGAKFCRALMADKHLLTEIEAKLRWAIYHLAKTRGDLIGQAVRQVLAGYSEEEMRDFIESKVGDDLMWIRLNGAVLGAVLGLVMFGVLHLCGVGIN